MSSSFSALPGRERDNIENFIYPELVGASEYGHEEVPVPQETLAADQPSAQQATENDFAKRLAEARAEGIAQGLRQAETHFADEVAKERGRISKAFIEFQQQRSSYYSKVEVELVHLALAIAKKILHRESQIDRMVVAGLVRTTLERMQQKSNVIVRVPPDHVHSWQDYFRDHKGVEICGDTNLEPGGCLLETELGLADLGLDAQLKEVEQGFFDLLAHKPEASK